VAADGSTVAVSVTDSLWLGATLDTARSVVVEVSVLDVTVTEIALEVLVA
jgi:hypothetical protein